MENISTAARNKMALKYGLITGVIYILIATIVNLLVDNLIAFYALKIFGYVLYFIIIGIFVSKIKKANGGFLDFKNTFSSIIIIVALAGLLYYVYNYVYMEYINPQFIYRVKAAMVSFMESYKMTDDKIEQSTRAIDKQIAESKNFNFGKNILSYFESLILDSLFGLIVAAIVKKNKPEFLQ